MTHAKAESTPSDYDCPECGKPTHLQFGKNGRFLSCSGYPECKFACPCDKEGKMVKDEVTEHKCPKCGKPMVRKNGRYGAFLGCSDYPECKTTLRLDKEGNALPPETRAGAVPASSATSASKANWSSARASGAPSWAATASRAAERSSV